MVKAGGTSKAVLAAAAAVAAALLIAGTRGAAQTSHPPEVGGAAKSAPAAPAGHAAHGGAAGAKTAVAIDGLSAHRHPIRTASAEAQKFFDQGLNFCFAFNHEEAARAFRQAARLDPKAPMPLWGLAYALGPTINMPRSPDRDKEALAAIQKAKQLAAGGSEVEQAYVEAMTPRYSDEAGADGAKRDEAYADAMRDLAKRYPDDLDAATIFAEAMMDLRPWKLWSTDGKPAAGTKEIVAVLEGVLKRDPTHPGANHYYIHAVEASPNPEKALASAHMLEGLAPMAGHLEHMPGHIYLRTGDYARAVKVNVTAAAADRALFAKAGKQGMYPLMYYTHNLHFIMASSALEGRENPAHEYAVLVQNEIKPVLKQEPFVADFLPMYEAFLPSPLFMDLRFRNWDSILRLSPPDSRLVVGTALWRAARAVAHCGKGDLKSADTEATAFLTARAQVPEGAGFGLSAAADVLDIAGNMMNGRLLEAKGDHDGAIAAWRGAVEAQGKLNYNEPPDWYYPTRESLGGALLRAGKAQEAEEVFREDLDYHPRNGRSLFGLWKSLEAQKKEADAGFVKREFQAAWKNATVALRVEDL